MSKILRCVAGVLLVVATCAAAQMAPNIAALKAKAESGDAKAQNRLGWLYWKGLGVPKDYAQAAVWYRKAAEQGDADAQCSLGGQYEFGEGVTQDYTQAAIWYRKAADQGVADAQFFLGMLFDNGEGVRQDYVQAATWIRKAAEQGEPLAQYTLGALYADGKGVPKDYTQAATWMRKAADQGNATAQFGLGALYEDGNGVPQDYAQAASWYSKAADQGNADAQVYLGQLYFNGQGVKQDYAQAAAFYRKAAEQGNATAKHKYSALTSIQEDFPLQVTIERSIDTGDAESGLTPQEQITEQVSGMEPVYSAFFYGKVDGEDHWKFDCRKENMMRESLPCTTLSVGEYLGRWIHDHNLLQIVGGPPENPTLRFLTVSENPKNPPSADDPVLRVAAYDFPVRFPKGKTLKDYPVLIHIYGGYSLELPIGQLPAHGNCTVYAWSAYQTSVNCASYPSVEINRGYVNLDFSAGAINFASLHCEAKWRWSHCSMVDPGLYYARVDKDRLVLLTHNQDGKPEEVGFTAELPRNKVQSPIK